MQRVGNLKLSWMWEDSSSLRLGELDTSHTTLDIKCHSLKYSLNTKEWNLIPQVSSSESFFIHKKSQVISGIHTLNVGILLPYFYFQSQQSITIYQIPPTH